MEERDKAIAGFVPTEYGYAKNNNLILISKDADMHQRSFMFGPPPKVIWVRLGNAQLGEVGKIVRHHFEASKRLTQTFTHPFSVCRKSQMSVGKLTSHLSQPHNTTTRASLSIWLR